MADYGIDPFGKLMEAERMITQDKFQRQKYDDLMQRQQAQDAMSAQANELELQDRQMKTQAPQMVQELLKQQFDSYSSSPQAATGQKFQPNFNRMMVDAGEGAGQNPYFLGAVQDYSDLLKSPTAKTPSYSATSDYISSEKAAYKAANNGQEMPPDLVAQKHMEYKRAQAGEQGSTTRAKELSKVGVEANKGIYEGAVNAKKSIVKIDKLINELNTSDALTGMGADIAKQFARIGAEIGIERAKGTVIDTEYLNALMGSEVFPLIKQLGIGARGMDTPAERQFLREVMTGQIPMNKGTLLKMAQDRRQAAQMDVVRYQKRDSVGAMDGLYGQGFTKLTFDGDGAGSGGMDQSRPVTKGGVTGYRQPNGDVLGANGEKLN